MQTTAIDVTTVADMTSIFTSIIAGDVPGRFVYADDRAVAFLTIAPIQPGHVLVVPRDEVDHWVDLQPELAGHLMSVSHLIGRALDREFGRARVGLIIAGLEVPHTHLHLVPFDTEDQLSFSRADSSVPAAELDTIADRIRAALGPDAASTP